LPTVAAFPCLLLPSPDAVLFLGAQFISLPATVRPFAFWAQAAVLYPTELRTTNAILIHGYQWGVSNVRGIRRRVMSVARKAP
tara:strand:- start:2190 stop:2438 length:249 start_codon:yes stop_codon:yes gene_type:complete